MKLYHGTKYRNIDDFKIICRNNNIPEFGDGIYFTSNYNQAKKWSCSKSNTGAIYEIDINLSELKGKNLNNSDLFLYVSYLNRIDLKKLVDECLEELDNIDYVYGKMIKDIPIFKDKAEKFNDGDINKEEFRKTIKCFDENMDQFCFRSEKARNLINSSISKVTYTKKVKNRVIECKNQPPIYKKRS